MLCRLGRQIAAFASAVLVVQLMAHQAARAQETDVRTVSGVVKNRLTGQPIPRALVDGGYDAMLTDSEGRFELHLPTRAFAELKVRRPEYNSGQSGTHPLQLEGDVPGVVLYLTPAAIITGHVSTPDGADTNRMAFTAYRRRTWNGHTQWLQAESAYTDPDGIFKMYDLPGDYVLCNHTFLHRAAGAQQGKPGRGIPAQCYPADPGDSADNLLHLAPGQQAEVEITRTMQPFYPVTITVVNQAAGPGRFQVYSQNGLPTGAMLRSKEDGGTEVDLPNGSYFAVSGSWDNKVMAYGRVDFKLENGAPAALTLVVSPLAPVLVRFHKDFTASAKEQEPSTVMVNNDAPPAQIEVMPAYGVNGNRGMRRIRRAEGGPSDVFEMDFMTPGRYWVQAVPFGEGYASAITSDGVDLSREPLTIGPGNAVAPIEITLRNDTGQIDCTVNGLADRIKPTEGFVSSVRQGPGATVYVIPAGDRPSRLARANTLTAGPASIPNLAPGKYRVIALENDRDLDSMDDKELASLKEKGKTVTVPAGGTVSVQVDLIKDDDEEPAL